MAFAYAEEIIIEKSTLEPIGNVKIINIPKVEVVKDILVYDREDVSKDHKKNIFNRNPNKKKNKIK